MSYRCNTTTSLILATEVSSTPSSCRGTSTTHHCIITQSSPPHSLFQLGHALLENAHLPLYLLTLADPAGSEGGGNATAQLNVPSVITAPQSRTQQLGSGLVPHTVIAAAQEYSRTDQTGMQGNAAVTQAKKSGAVLLYTALCVTHGDRDPVLLHVQTSHLGGKASLSGSRGAGNCQPTGTPPPLVQLRISPCLRPRTVERHEIRFLLCPALPGSRSMHCCLRFCCAFRPPVICSNRSSGAFSIVT